MFFKSTALLSLIPIAFALPQYATPSASTEITADLITQIAPDTASCDGAAMPKECADASVAAPAITKSFAKYGITTNGQKAALLAIMLFESGDFKYNHNHYPAPGRPGQGTRNMQSADFNLLYAKSLFDEATVSAAQTQGPDAVLALVQGDDESFGSAAWFMSTQCTESVKNGLSTGSAEGWSAYLTQCVGTTDTPDRDAGWKAVTAVLPA